MIESNLEKKRFGLSGNFQPIMKGSQDNNLEARIEAKATEDCYILGFSPWFAQPVFLYPQDHNPGTHRNTHTYAHTHRGLSPPM